MKFSKEFISCFLATICIISSLFGTELERLVPKVAAKFDDEDISGVSVIRGVEEKLGPAVHTGEIPAEAIFSAAEKYIDDVIEERCVLILLKGANLAPTPELVRNLLMQNFDAQSENIKREIMAKLKSRNIKFDQYIEQKATNPAEQFKLASQLWIERDFSAKITASEDEIRNFYYKNPQLFNLPEVRDVALIGLKKEPAAEAKAEKLIKLLQQGEMFELLKASYNQIPDNELSEIAKLPATLEVAKILHPNSNEFTIAQLPNCTLIMKLTRYAPERTLTLEEARPTLLPALRELKIHSAVNAAIATEKSKHKIEKYIRNTQK